MSQHQAKFTWGAGPNSVHIAGNFNNWSGTATPLSKQPDGSFASDVSVPWGEKQAFKYVVDGEWKVREDEAKEWDAAGNMNNVYTAPHAPTPAPAAAPTSATTEPTPTQTETIKEVKETKAEEAVVPAAAATTLPSASAADTPAPVKSEPTQPATLLASSAPGAASSGPAPILGGPILGGVIGSTKSAQPTTTTTEYQSTEPVKATAAVPIEAAPAVSDPTPVKIEKAAANANIGEAPVNGEHHTLQEQVAEYGAGALGAIGAALGGAVVAVEKVTGIDLGHGNPLSVEEARSQGIDIKALQQTELGTDAVSPVGTKPPASAVAALEEKTQQLKLDSGVSTTSAPKDQAAVPLPNGEAPKSQYANAPEPLPSKADEPVKHDIPAQDETKDNHKSVPAPVIVPVSAKDPKKDRSLEAPNNKDTAGTKPITNDPAVSAADAKKQAENHPAGSGSTPAVAQGKATPTPKSSLPSGETVARPDAPANNLKVESPPTPPKDISSPAAPATPAKTAAGPTAATSTPAKVAPATPASATSTPASTPAKSAHTKEGTSGSDIRKRKSSFFSKIKHAFSPKDKEKK